MSNKKPVASGEKAALQLLARGDCYNPTCSQPLITTRDGKNIIKFEIAHIRDELPPASQESQIGWRFWPADDMSHRERNHFDNLILLCSPCHKLVDKIAPQDFSVELLQSWKSDNESDRSAALSHSFGVVATPPQLQKLEQRLLNTALKTNAELEQLNESQSELLRVSKDLLGNITGGESIPMLDLNNNFAIRHHSGSYPLFDVRAVLGEYWYPEPGEKIPADYLHPSPAHHLDKFVAEWACDKILRNHSQGPKKQINVKTDCLFPLTYKILYRASILTRSQNIRQEIAFRGYRHSSGEILWHTAELIICSKQGKVIHQRGYAKWFERKPVFANGQGVLYSGGSSEVKYSAGGNNLNPYLYPVWPDAIGDLTKA